MRKTLLFWPIFTFVLALILPRQAVAAPVAGASAVMVQEGAWAEDLRVKQLERFLTYYKSPLAGYSRQFVQMADKYGLDWKLLPCISGVESTFGKQLIPNTYNAYGWGGGKICFESWEDSIEKVSLALSEKYYARGLDTPCKIAPVYCPPSKVWAGNVTYFMTKLEEFGNEIPSDPQINLI